MAFPHIELLPTNSAEYSLPIPMLCYTVTNNPSMLRFLLVRSNKDIYCLPQLKTTNIKENLHQNLNVLSSKIVLLSNMPYAAVRINETTNVDNDYIFILPTEILNKTRSDISAQITNLFVRNIEIAYVYKKNKNKKSILPDLVYAVIQPNMEKFTQLHGLLKNKSHPRLKSNYFLYDTLDNAELAAAKFEKKIVPLILVGETYQHISQDNLTDDAIGQCGCDVIFVDNVTNNYPNIIAKSAQIIHTQ